MLCLAQVALTPLACASFSIPMICSSLNLLFISFCSFYLSRTTLFNCPLFGDQARIWLDVEDFDGVIGHPISDSVSDELRAVVAAQMFGHSVAFDRCLDHGDGIDGPDRPGDMSCQSLLGVLVDEG